MSYQRWGKLGRFYIWAGSDGLHIWPPDDVEGAATVLVTKDQAGRDNAKAMLLGLVDLLSDLGVAVTIHKGKCKFTKISD